jgi:hypothetical protein
MPQPLIAPGQLIKESWSSFVSTWDTMVRYSAWYVLAGVLTAAYLFLPDAALMGAIGLFVYLAGLAVMVWTSIRVYQVAFAFERKEKISNKTTETALALFLPLLWVSILAGLATIGGFILLILPGIYLAVRFAFGQLAVIDAKKKGVEALKDSWALTKNRFWAVLGRELAGGVVFGALFLAVSWLAVWIVAKIAGAGAYEAMTATEETNPALAGTSIVINGMVQAAFIPLFYIFQVKLYKALIKSR